MRFIPPKLYPITDVRISGLSHLEQAKRLADGGATLIQLREKERMPGEWFDDAVACAQFCLDNGVTLIVNDRVDLAMVIGADGVHLGQADMPVTAARELLGPEAIIGLSTHDLCQVREAADLPVDYIGFGPIFPTITKSNPDAVVGLELLSQARQVSDHIPIVAIGGITLGTASSVIAAGAASVAMIGDLLVSPADIRTRTRHLLSLL